MSETAAFQSQVTSIMESLVKATVFETTKLFELSVRGLRTEMIRIQKENEALKSRMGQSREAGRTSEQVALPNAHERGSGAPGSDPQAGGAAAPSHPAATEEEEEEQVMELNPVAFQEGNPLLQFIFIKQECDGEEIRPRLFLLKQERQDDVPNYTFRTKNSPQKHSCRNQGRP
ncbi:hypothetical protein JZ751_022091 [Albula glossodonta]|uniref:Uncharacterized protein n=1 Tax=Albula glossodonta TaxID=121402 RepID=A0A8T2MRP2_9TELE|nr:hypothetical protein JZ751_022091 [Albula glossodonta]